MVKLGYLNILKARTEKNCAQCHEIIKAAKWYVMTTGRSKGTWFNHRYHLECYPQYMLDRVREAQKNPKSTKHKTSRYDALTPEQINRRKTLQVYLRGKDKVRLIKAYQNKDSTKVYRAYQIIATRWIELHQMGKPFRNSLVSRQEKFWSDNDRKLFNLLMNNDYMWANKFADETDVERKIAMLLSRESDVTELQPQW